jgi:Trypsin-like peptidase domain
MREIRIELLSMKSLLIEQVNGGTEVGKATGFFVEFNSIPYLITNWHVVTGKNRFTGEMLLKSGTPDSLRIWKTLKGEPGKWRPYEVNLYDPTTGEPGWIEHKDKSVDVVAFPLVADPNASYNFVNIEDECPDISINPAETISVVGFPFGVGNFNFAVWKTGHIASDIDIDYNNLPVFLIDATTKPSMSGSPVYFRRYNYNYIENSTKRLAHLDRVTKFLGVYSGRTHDLSDIGMVWKPRVISEILHGTLVYLRS